MSLVKWSRERSRKGERRAYRINFLLLNMLKWNMWNNRKERYIYNIFQTLLIAFEDGMVYYYMHWQNFQGAVEGYNLKRVDTTGAGDAFVGALLHKIVDDFSIFQVNQSPNCNMISVYEHLIYVTYRTSRYLWTGWSKTARCASICKCVWGYNHNQEGSHPCSSFSLSSPHSSQSWSTQQNPLWPFKLFPLHQERYLLTYINAISIIYLHCFMSKISIIQVFLVCIHIHIYIS